MVLTCGLIEYEPLSVSLMEQYIGRTPGLELVWTCGSAEEAHTHLERYNPDLVFWEVRTLPAAVASILLPIVKYHAGIIVTSAYFPDMIEGLPFRALDYLHKPFSYQQFLRSIDQYRFPPTD
ncbi:hypothetical protein GCM10027275_51100 [Rhabdobacter roseus]|uniref:Response regulator of citrate/malate metabolism n=1 Tax=Rhabdobacter roseus TaxID=1655419 RepID=A0A840TVA7_9BACT|nr:hypothetical protein [Rhabdobacter roseus]MBB5287184.1 response regulator of citrate/malate metabolism [Rhabdobacter roseus]